MESYPIIIRACAHNKDDKKKWKHLMMNVAEDWYTNLQTFDKGGHGSSFDYQCGAFVRSFKTKSQ